VVQFRVSIRAYRAVIGRDNPTMRGFMKEERSQAPVVQTLTRRQALVNAALAIGAFGAISRIANAAPSEDISRNSESLHQELVFKANRKRVYQIFTSTALFDKMAHDIQAKESGASGAVHPTEISHEVGGAFSLFGGRIIGRHLELVADERIVQAWRVAYWELGVYSIVRLDFAEQGPETKILFAHTGFPQGDAENLLNGWKLHYWQPLEKFLAS
jgi:activator of HSP90 ATPase